MKWNFAKWAENLDWNPGLMMDCTGPLCLIYCVSTELQLRVTVQREVCDSVSFFQSQVVIINIVTMGNYYVTWSGLVWLTLHICSHVGALIQTREHWGRNTPATLQSEYTVQCQGVIITSLKDCPLCSVESWECWGAQSQCRADLLSHFWQFKPSSFGGITRLMLTSRMRK